MVYKKFKVPNDWPKNWLAIRCPCGAHLYENHSADCTDPKNLKKYTQLNYVPPAFETPGKNK